MNSILRVRQGQLIENAQEKEKKTGMFLKNLLTELVCPRQCCWCIYSVIKYIWSIRI